MRRVSTLLIIAVLALASCNRGNENFTFVQLCDPQLGFGGYSKDSAALVQAVDQINQLDPDFVVVCGDMVHNPGDKVYSDFKMIMTGLEMPYYLAPGNHDMGSSSAQPELDSLYYYREMVGEDYYTFSFSNYNFVVVNTSLWTSPLAGETEKQEAWLRETLDDLPRRDSLVIVAHHQLFNNNPSETDERAPIKPEKRDELLALFNEVGMSIYLHGHTHTTSAKEIDGVQYVSGETTSVNFDRHPFGLTLWEITDTSATHIFVPLETEQPAGPLGNEASM